MANRFIKKIECFPIYISDTIERDSLLDGLKNKYYYLVSPNFLFIYFTETNSPAHMLLPHISNALQIYYKQLTTLEKIVLRKRCFIK